MKTILLFLIGLVTICGQGYMQPQLEITKINTGKLKWSFFGKTNLPNHTIVACQLYYRDFPLPGSDTWQWIKDKKFILSIYPKK